MAGAGPLRNSTVLSPLTVPAASRSRGSQSKNGPGEGILGTHGAAFTVHNTTVQDNGRTGVAVGEGSTAELTNCSLLRNGSPGIDVFTQSSAVLKGAIRINKEDESTILLLQLRFATHVS